MEGTLFLRQPPVLQEIDNDVFQIDSDIFEIDSSYSVDYDFQMSQLGARPSTPTLNVQPQLPVAAPFMPPQLPQSEFPVFTGERPPPELTNTQRAQTHDSVCAAYDQLRLLLQTEYQAYSALGPGLLKRERGARGHSLLKNFQINRTSRLTHLWDFHLDNLKLYSQDLSLPLLSRQAAKSLLRYVRSSLKNLKNQEDRDLHDAATNNPLYAGSTKIEAMKSCAIQASLPGAITAGASVCGFMVQNAVEVIQNAVEGAEKTAMVLGAVLGGTAGFVHGTGMTSYFTPGNSWKEKGIQTAGGLFVAGLERVMNFPRKPRLARLWAA